MKKITKLFVTSAAAVALFFGFSGSANAQTSDAAPWRMGIGLNLGIPTESYYGFAVGGDVRLQKTLTPGIAGILSLGYTSFSAKNSGINYDFVPLKAGAKFFVAENVYVSGELGAGFETQSGGGTTFLYAPGVGYASDRGLDLGLRYEGASRNGGSLGQVALRIAYGFQL